MSAPGSRVLVRRFFDEFPRFYESSETSPRPWRLNLRHAAIFQEHAALFRGKRVLDIASHDGRWTMAALDAGAAHVVGIEGRSELVQEASSTLVGYGISEERFSLVEGDVFEVLAKQSIEVEVVLCLGFFYHTMRYNELWTRVRECNPTDLLVDTLIEPDVKEAYIRVTTERVARQGNAIADAFSYGDAMLIGRPSRRALRVMGRAYGFDLAGTSDWAGLIRDNPDADGIGDYKSGRRITAHFRRSA